MKNYKPTIYKKNVEEINYDKLKKSNIKCLLFDLDNTIVSGYKTELSYDIINLIDKLKKDFIVVIFSNTYKKRAMKICNRLDVDIVAFAMKPSKYNFKKIFKRYNLKSDEVAIIGDQLMTDIKGGNKVNITTILVDPISKKELPLTKINRILENYHMNKISNNSFKRGNYYE